MRNVGGVLGVALGLAVLVSVAPAAWPRLAAVPSKPLPATIDIEVSPQALPTIERAPLALTVGTTMRTQEGSVPSALAELLLQFDRNSSIDVKGLPSCELSGRNIRRSLDEIKRTCRDSIVGSGKAGFEVAFPGEAPVASSPPALIIFNFSTDEGPPVLYALTEMTYPVVGLIPMRIGIRRKPKGRIGAEAIVSVPKVLNGNAALTDLSLTLHRRISGRASRAGIISARCPEGKFLVGVRMTFADGSEMPADVVHRCTPQAGYVASSIDSRNGGG
jgi:hypothetical protein